MTLVTKEISDKIVEVNVMKSLLRIGLVKLTIHLHLIKGATL